MRSQDDMLGSVVVVLLGRWDRMMLDSRTGRRSSAKCVRFPPDDAVHPLSQMEQLVNTQALALRQWDR
jgi:hypothetical protein